MKFADALKHAIAKFNDPEFLSLRKLEDPTMLRHMAILQEINSAGFLTDESQAGRKNVGTSNTGKNYVNHERAYISGYMLKSRAVSFLQEIGTTTDKIAFTPELVNPTRHVVGTNIPLSFEDVDGEDRRVYSRMPTYLEPEVAATYKEELNINKNEPVLYISIFDGRWNRGAVGAKGLFTEVLRCLKNQ